MSLVCICIINLSAIDGMAQQKPWSLRVCIEHAREHNLQVEYARVSLENTSVDLSREKAQRLPSLDFSSTQGGGHQKSSSYTGTYSLNGNILTLDLYSDSTGETSHLQFQVKGFADSIIISSLDEQTDDNNFPSDLLIPLYDVYANQ